MAEEFEISDMSLTKIVKKIRAKIHQDSTSTAAFKCLQEETARQREEKRYRGIPRVSLGSLWSTTKTIGSMPRHQDIYETMSVHISGDIKYLVFWFG